MAENKNRRAGKLEEDKNNESKKIIDRSLGDEWAGWTGNLSEHEKEIREGISLFFGLYFSALFAVFAVIIGFFYLIMPRLNQVNENLDIIILSVISAVFLLIFLWSALLLLTCVTGRKLVPLIGSGGPHIEWIFPAIYKIAGFLGISRDRVRNSFALVNNRVVYAVKKKFKSLRLLALLPRCLDRETRMKVMEITKKYGVKSFTATGGSSALKMVKKENPDAIIGVACERDLAAGMADAPHNIPTIAIANQRPEGPCKNTKIDVDEFERAIKFFLNG